jgi:hypothetical protein
VDDTALVWRTFESLAPIARVIDGASLRAWQRAVTLFAIGFGVCASVLAAVVIEMTRWAWSRSELMASHTRIEPPASTHSSGADGVVRVDDVAGSE